VSLLKRSSNSLAGLLRTGAGITIGSGAMGTGLLVKSTSWPGCTSPVLSHRDKTIGVFSGPEILMLLLGENTASASDTLESILCLLELCSTSDLGEPDADDMDVRGLMSGEWS